MLSGACRIVFAAERVETALSTVRQSVNEKSELDVGPSCGGPASMATTWRVNSVDLLSGVLMALMLLDHMYEFVHRDMLNFDATDLNRTSVLLFFTRWVTHFCALVFVFLTGTGAFLQLARGKSKSELSKFLVKRRLWLILLEFTLIRVIVWLNLDFTSRLNCK